MFKIKTIMPINTFGQNENYRKDKDELSTETLKEGEFYLEWGQVPSEKTNILETTTIGREYIFT